MRLHQELAGIGIDRGAGDDLAPLALDRPSQDNARPIARDGSELTKRETPCYRAVLQVRIAVYDVSPDRGTIEGGPEEFGGDGAVGLSRDWRRVPGASNQLTAIDGTWKDPQSITDGSLGTAGETTREKVVP